jgi:hypothetical protein
MSIKMSTSKMVSLALVVALTNATPLPKIPTRILPRELPTPSAYPGKEGACVHEWQYLNFNVDDTTDQQRLDKLHHTICSGEMRALTSYGAGAAEDLLAPYKRFFPEDDDEDTYEDVQDHVVKVLTLLMGTSSSDGAIGSIVGDFVIDNLGKSHLDNTRHDLTDKTANLFLQISVTNTQKKPTRTLAVSKELWPTPPKTKEPTASKPTASRRFTSARLHMIVPTSKRSRLTAPLLTPTRARRWTHSRASPCTK